MVEGLPAAKIIDAHTSVSARGLQGWPAASIRKQFFTSARRAQGRPYAIFRRALERKNMLSAETTKELPPLNLTDALDLTTLIARKDPRRHPRVGTRWLLRYLEECDRSTIDEAAMVAACLAALSGDRHRDAALTLRAIAESA